MVVSQTARFHDGKTSAPKEVTVELVGKFLLIRYGCDVVAKWSFADLFVKEDWSEGIGAVIGCRHAMDASLAIFQIKLFTTLQKKLARRQRASFIIPTRFGVLAGLSFAAILMVYFFLPLVSHLAKWTTHLIPFTMEQRLGEFALDTMEREYPACDDRAVIALLERISGRLLLQSGRDIKLQPKFHLYRTADVNAFTLPGENIAVLTGFLESAKSEAEIAGVLAHEYGHMIERDALEAFIEAQGFDLIAKFATSSSAYGGVTEIASVMQILKYSRQKEFAADAFAVRMLHRAGYSAAGLSGFLKRMDAGRGQATLSDIPAFEIFSTHPETEERLMRISELARVDPVSAYKEAPLSGAELQLLKEACSQSRKADRD